MVAGAALERDGVVAFRGVDAQRILKEEFEIDCSLSSTYRLLHRMKLSWLVPRPRHPEADARPRIGWVMIVRSAAIALGSRARVRRRPAATGGRTSISRPGRAAGNSPSA